MLPWQQENQLKAAFLPLGGYNSKHEVSDSHFLLLVNNPHVKVKLSAKFKKKTCRRDSVPP